MVYYKKVSRKNRSNFKTSGKNLPIFLTGINLWSVNNLVNSLYFLVVVTFLFLVLQGFFNQDIKNSNINQSAVRSFTNTLETPTDLERGKLKPFQPSLVNNQKTQVRTDSELERSSLEQKRNQTTETDSETRTYIVQQGDTLSGISTKKNIPLIQILEINPELSEPFDLKIDQELKLPKQNRI